MTKWVYAFEEGNRDPKFLLGGKGANLAEMTNLGLPVPGGFTITTEACNEYMRLNNAMPADLMDQVSAERTALEAKTGKKLGDGNDPLLVSVRSGAAFSMPGMMDTVLNLGLNDASVQGLAKQTNNERFASTVIAVSCRCSPRSCSMFAATYSKKRCTTSWKAKASKMKPNSRQPR